MTSNVHATARSRAGSWCRFLGALLVLAAVAIGIPAALVVAARAGFDSSQPLPGLGSWDEIRAWATTERSSTELARVALRILISLCWLLWAALLASLVASIFDTRPKLGRVRLPRLAVFEGFGAWLVAGLTALSALTPNVAHARPATTRLPAAATAAPAPSTESAPAAPSMMSFRAPRLGWATVQPAESIEMFTARTLGAPGRWPEVFEVNKGRTMPDGTTFTQPWRLVAGWEMQLPDRVEPSVPIAATATNLVDGSPSTPGGDGTADVVIVAAGDNLWDLAAARLESVGVANTGPDIARSVEEIVALNPSIRDPSLIYVGQRLTMPALDTTPTGRPDVPASASATTADDETTHVVVGGDTLWDILEAHYGYVDAPLVYDIAQYNSLPNPNSIPIGTLIVLPLRDGPRPPVGASTEAETPVSAAEPAVVVTPVPMTLPAPAGPAVTLAPPTEPASAVPAAATPAPPTVPSIDGRGGVTSPNGSVLPWAVAGAGSVGLATGLLELWRRRRRARWSAGRSPWNVGAASEPLPDELLDYSDLVTVEWVAAALASVADDVDHPSALISVEFDAATLVLHWSESRPAPPPPWLANDNGRAWTLSRSAPVVASATGRLVGFPGLVTFGRRGDRQYMVNLAAVGTVAVDGPGADPFAASVALELGAGGVLSNAIVHLHGMELDACEQLDRVLNDFDDLLDASPTVHVSIIESDDPALDELIHAAQADRRRAVLILGISERQVGLEVRVESDGAATQSPSDARFLASLVPGALHSLDVAQPETEAEACATALRLERSPGSLVAPRTMLRLFSSLLPDLDPRPATVDARAMTIIAALDYLGTGHPPQRLAELLHVKVKTIQNKLARLRELKLVHSDGNTWRTDAGVCSDVDWLLSLADASSGATSRNEATRALSECWELLTRVTGPAYAAGGGSSLWSWIDERDIDFGGATAAEQATATLFKAVHLAVATWDVLADDNTDDLLPAERLVDVVLRVESSVRSIEPWPLFEAAGHAAARSGSPATRQKLATRLAQFVHDADVEPPERLVSLVTG